MGGTLTVNSPNALGSGGLTVAGGTVNGSATMNLPLNLQSGTLALSVSGGNAATKTTHGTVVMADSSSYTGGTTVSAGTLTVNNNLALGSGTLTVAGGAVNGSATLNIPLNLQSGTVALNLTGANLANKTTSGLLAITAGNSLSGAFNFTAPSAGTVNCRPPAAWALRR